MKKSIFLLFVILFVSCNGTVEEKDIIVDENGVADPRYFKGLYVHGSLQVENRSVEGKLVPFQGSGKLDLDELQASILSYCRNEIIEIQSGKTADIQCFGEISDLIPTEVNIAGTSCDSKLCAQSLYICAGHMNLKLAEAVAPITFTSKLPAYNVILPSISNQFAYNIELKIQDRYLFSETFHSLVAEEDSALCDETCSCLIWEGETGCRMNYTIPPQSPENRILLLLAAKHSFEMAGLSGIRVLEEVGFESSEEAAECYKRVVSSTTNVKNYKSSTGPSVDLPSVFVREFGEVQTAYLEIGEKLKNAQVAVATNHDNDVVEMDESWQGDNAFSRSYAAENILGQGVSSTACIQGIENDAVKIGVEFLRASKDYSVIDENATDIRDIGKSALQSIYSDLSGCLGADCIELEEYLDHLGITLNDLRKSRQYILEEQTANDRRFNTYSTKSGQNRVYNLAEKSLVHPVAYWESQALGNGFDLADEQFENIKGTYPRRSEAEFLNAMRNASNGLLSDTNVVSGMSPEVLGRYKALAYIGNATMGNSKVVVSTSGSQIILNLLGVFDRDVEENSIETLYLVREELESSPFDNDSGYRCLYEGTIDGAPCQISNYIMDSSNEIIASGQVEPFAEAVQVSFSPFVESPSGAPVLMTSKKIWLFTKRGGDGFKLVAGFDLQTLANTLGNTRETLKSLPSVLGDIAIEIPVHSQFSTDLIKPMMARANDNCQKVKSPLNTETGWSFSLPYDYVPPLEKETIDNNDAYENSWQHYLIEARDAANKADLAGEALIEKGLDIDDRTALSAETCSSICGGVVNPDAFDQGTNTGIDAECWSYDAKNAALGSYGLCRYTLKDQQSNVSLDWCECPEGKTCPECPILLSEEGASCETAFSSVEGAFPEGYTASIDYVEEKLNVYNSTAENISGYVNCENIRDYRELYRNNAVVNGEVFDNLIGKQSWFNQEYFQYLLKRYRLDEDSFFHYLVRDYGSVMWSTYKMHNRDITTVNGENTIIYNCPMKYPYRPEGDNTNDQTNEQINCESAKPCGDPLHTYLCDYNGNEITEPEEWLANEWGSGTMGPVGSRIIWGTRLGNIFKTLSALSGRTGGLSIPTVNYSGSEFDLAVVSPSGFEYRYLDMGDDGKLIGYVRSSIVYPDSETAYMGYPEAIKQQLLYQANSEEYAAELKNGFWGIADNKIRDTLDSKWKILGVLNRRKRLIPQFEDGKSYFHEFNEYTEAPDNLKERSLKFWQYNLGNNTDTSFYSVNGNQLPSIKDILTKRDGYAGGGDDGYLDNLIPGPDTDVEFERYAKIKHKYNITNPGDISIDFSMDDYISISADSIERQPMLYINGYRVLDALEFACHLADREEESCQSDFSEDDIEDKEDILKMQSYLNCAADKIHKRAQRLVIPNLPETLIKRFKSGSTSGLYPNLKGEKLQIYNKLETLLRKFGSSVENIKAVLRESSSYLNASYYSIVSLEKEGEIASLRSLQQIIGQAVSAVNTIFSPNANLGQKMITGSGSAAIIDQEIKISLLSEDAFDAKIQSALQTTIGQISQKMTELRQIMEGIEDIFSEINSSLSSLESLKTKAAKECANATLEDVSDEGHILYPNTVRRRRYVTAKHRYQEDLNNAKKMAYIARKAIEFRLGIDMNKMDYDLTLVDAPKYWVNDLTTITGIDYERIRDNEVLMSTEYDGNTEDYSHQYIGDYVTKLEQFMESYPIDFRYSNSSDVAVMSLRDDFKVPTDICSKLSNNELYYSDRIGGRAEVYDPETRIERTVGWSLVSDNCVDGSGESKRCIAIDSNSSLGTIDTNFCYFKSSDCATIDGVLVIPEAELVRDTTTYVLQKQCMSWGEDESGNSTCINYSLCPEGSTDLGEECSYEYPGPYNGFVEQTTDELIPGMYLLSFWHKKGMINTGQSRVEIVNADGNVIFTETIYDEEYWNQFKKAVLIQTGGQYTIRLYPSDGISIAGDILIYGMQLEKIDHTVPGCEGTGIEFSYNNCTPVPFERTSSTRYILKRGCKDIGGEQFRKLFERKCVCNDGEPCQSLEVDASCYYEIAFTLSLDEVESGNLIPSAAISVDNFNYRHGTVALNMVGTNVKQCDAESSTTCYSNAYATYSLYHDGSVWIKNHDFQHEHFSMPTSKIHNAKALASEMVLTNPLSSNQQTMLNEYQKSEFRGRPINGKYILRVYEIDGFNFQNLEDIQMLWRYNYWTKEN